MSGPTRPNEAVRRALQASGVRPLRVRDAVSHLGSGYANDAYLVRAAGGDLVLRVPRPGSPWAVPDLVREVRLLGVLARHDLGTTIPSEARVLRDGRVVLGTLHRFVPGTPLREVRGRGRTLARQVGGFLSRLHAVPVETALRAGVRGDDLWDERYAPLIEEAMPALGPRSRAWLRGVAADFLAAGGSAAAPRVLVHGDISGWHLLADNAGGLAGVIDFGDARVGDPAIDLAGLLNDASPAFLAAVLAHYAGPRGDTLGQRIAFYIATAPLFRVVYGEAAEGPAERLAGIRQLAARAAASTRRGAPARG